jgi:hypothetical protein
LTERGIQRKSGGEQGPKSSWESLPFSLEVIWNGGGGRIRASFQR